MPNAQVSYEDSYPPPCDRASKKTKRSSEAKPSNACGGRDAGLLHAGSAQIPQAHLQRQQQTPERRERQQGSMSTSKNFTTSGNSPAKKARQETADPERQSFGLRGTHKPECAKRCHPACGLRPARDGENEALDMIISEACTVGLLLANPGSLERIRGNGLASALRSARRVRGDLLRAQPSWSDAEAHADEPAAAPSPL